LTKNRSAPYAVAASKPPAAAAAMRNRTGRCLKTAVTRADDRRRD
jgi:hypothetical protein